MDAQISGEGKFLIAKWNGLSTSIYGRYGEIKDDLVLEPYQEKVIDKQWLDVPHFVKDMRNGKITLYNSDAIPERKSVEVSEQYSTVLDDQQKANARMIVLAPEIDDAMRGVIQIDSNIDDNGFPRKGSWVTVAYLKEHQLPFLEALTELESRLQNRKAVVSLCKKAADRIRKM